MAEVHPGKGKADAVWQLLVGPPVRLPGHGRRDHTDRGALGSLARRADVRGLRARGDLLVLAVAGAGALHLVLPITIAIVLLLAILVFSYRQVIDAYPTGGGAYAVSRANLGAHTSLVAAAGSWSTTRSPSRSPSRPGSRAAVRLPVARLGHDPPLPRDPRLHHLAQPARPRRHGPRLPTAYGRVHRRAPGRHRGRTDPPPGARREAARDLAAADGRAEGGHRSPRPEGLLGGLQRVDGSGGDRQRGALFREPRAVRAKRTEMLLGVILGLCCSASPCWPSGGRSVPAPARPC